MRGKGQSFFDERLNINRHIILLIGRKDTMLNINLLNNLHANGTASQVDQTPAKGVMRLDPRTLGEILLILAVKSRGNIRSVPKETLLTLPESIRHKIAVNRDMHPDLLDTMARAFADDPKILTRLALNKSTKNETIDYIATLSFEKVLDIITVNHNRLINFPQIVTTLLNNTYLTQSACIHLQTYKKDLMEQKIIRAVDSKPMKPLPRERDFDDKAGKEVEEKEHRTVAQRIRDLTVPEKIVLARMANKQERSILIRDPSKEVALEVVQSPKITEGEAEMIARMRDVHNDVIREIAHNRDWTKKTTIAAALVNNPKTPVEIACQLISRIHHRDLRILSMNRNISGAVRATAKLLLANVERHLILQGRKH